MPSKSLIEKRPIDRAFEEICELKILIRNQNKQITNVEKILNQVKNQLKDLQDFKEKEIIEREKSRQGWIF
tara:strand:- start:60 stop:272 length:213 start_codon:yes stop_codon:yes gene_type:complete